MILNIKNMVGNRCKMAVTVELHKLGLSHGTVTLGEIEFLEEVSDSQQEQLLLALQRIGFHLLYDRKAVLVERIKNKIIESVHYTEDRPMVKYSIMLSESLRYDYTYLSNIFSESVGMTIEHFTIQHKVERIKELIANGEYNFTEISYRLHYSSLAHLSNQFKKITGHTPSHFKKMKIKRFIGLEEI